LFLDLELFSYWMMRADFALLSFCSAAVVAASVDLSRMVSTPLYGKDMLIYMAVLSKRDSCSSSRGILDLLEEEEKDSSHSRQIRERFAAKSRYWRESSRVEDEGGGAEDTFD
jgi:hypothetical protein